MNSAATADLVGMLSASFGIGAAIGMVLLA